jgi:hypothetical protein
MANHSHNFIDLKGQRFGRLVVTRCHEAPPKTSYSLPSIVAK